MAASINTSGTQTAVISTEHTLATITTAGTFQLAVDTTNMVNSDILELRAKMKLIDTGHTLTEVFVWTYQNIQQSPIKLSVPLMSPTTIVFTLKQTAGTGRAFDWEVIAA